MKKYYMELLIVLFAVLMTGCSTYSKVEILQEENYKQIKLNSNEKYKVAELRFSSNREEHKNKDTVLDGRLYTEWLEKQYPNVFSTDDNAIPIIVREKMTLPTGLMSAQQQQEDFVGVFDAIFSQVTFFFWPASITHEIEFETDIQLNDEQYSKPFVWNTKYYERFSNNITKALFFSSYDSYGINEYANAISKSSKLERIIASKKTSDQQKLEAKDEQFFGFYGIVNTPDVMRRGTAYGIIGALSQLSSSQKQMVTENKVARYLVEKAEGKLNDNSQNALPAKVESIE